MDIEKLPKTIVRKMFIVLHIAGWRAGDIGVYGFDSAKDDDNEVLLGTQMVTFKIPQDVDVKGEALKGLRNTKSMLEGKHHMELKTVQDKIDQLLAIEYKPEGKK